MFIFIVTVHVLVSLVLIVVVLLQSGKGGGLASAFGGSGGTDAVFGGRGAATFLGKMTTVLGTVFFVTSLLLAVASTNSMSQTTTPRANAGYAEPQPFNPETEIMTESAKPPQTTQEASGAAGAKGAEGAEGGQAKSP